MLVMETGQNAMTARGALEIDTSLKTGMAEVTMTKTRGTVEKVSVNADETAVAEVATRADTNAEGMIAMVEMTVEMNVEMTVEMNVAMNVEMTGTVTRSEGENPDLAASDHVARPHISHSLCLL